MGRRFLFVKFVLLDFSGLDDCGTLPGDHKTNKFTDMKVRQRTRISLTADGKDVWEQTEAYKKNVAKIEKEVAEKYSNVLSAEKNWIKRFLIRIRVQVEIANRIDEVSSSRNLHFGASSLLSIR